MGQSFYLTAQAVCAALLLYGGANRPAEAANNAIPMVLPVAQYNNGQSGVRPYQVRRVAYRPAPRTAPRQITTPPTVYWWQPTQVQAPTPAPAPRFMRANYSAPIPQIDSSYTLDQDFDTWSRVFRNFRLPDQASHPRVQQFVRSYAKNPSQLNLLSERASLFLHMIIAEVERRGMPAELALLPFVESGFDADIFSPAGAAGLWQFIPSTGRDYGLKQASNYDARMDPFAATGAALNYLQKLHREFNGDWFLALAAYNCGENRVHRAVTQAQQAGLRPLFWNLSLPKETMDYVPRLMAFRELISHSQHYGIRLPATPNSAKLAQMRTNKPIDLRQAAVRAGLPAYYLAVLNPCFRTGVTTPEHSNRIILPREYADRLAQVIREMPAASHTVRARYASWNG